MVVLIIKFSALLTGIAVIMLFYGIKTYTTPTVKLSRFMMQSYSTENDAEFMDREKELREIEKLYKVDKSKKILLFVIGAVTCGAIGYIISGTSHISIVSSFFGLTAPVVFEKWHAEGRKRQMEKQFEQAAEQMALVISSGGSIHSAIERASQDAKYPLKRELDLMVAQTKLNMPIAEVFKWANERIPVPELEMMVMVASLQQQGMAVNISSVLQRMQESIRARRAFRERVSAITAGDKLAAKVVGAIPFIVIGFIRKAAPQFVEPLFTTVWGMTLLAVSVIAIIGGMFWINKMIESN